MTKYRVKVDKDGDFELQHRVGWYWHHVRYWCGRVPTDDDIRTEIFADMEKRRAKGARQVGYRKPRIFQTYWLRDGLDSPNPATPVITEPKANVKL